MTLTSSKALIIEDWYHFWTVWKWLLWNFNMPSPIWRFMHFCIHWTQSMKCDIDSTNHQLNASLFGRNSHSQNDTIQQNINQYLECFHINPTGKTRMCSHTPMVVAPPLFYALNVSFVCLAVWDCEDSWDSIINNVVVLVGLIQTQT